MAPAALSRAARRALQEGDLGDERWQRFAARAIDLVDTLSIREVAQLTSKFATSRFRSFDFYCRMSSRLMSQLEASADAAANITHLDLRLLAVAFGRARAFDTEVMERLVPLIAERVQDFRPRDICRIVDAYARMPVQSPELFALAADALPPYLYDLAPAELAGLARSFAEAAVYNAELTDALCQEVVQRRQSFGAMECLIFLEGLAHLQAGLSEEMRRKDAEAIAVVVDQLAMTLGSLAIADLVRLFQCFVLLDHYDPKVMHLKLLPALAQKLGQLSGPRAFADLAELLHGLSLLPTQSHKSAELSVAAAAALRACRPPAGRVQPRSVALAAAALAQLGHEDEETIEVLGALLVGPRGDAGLAQEAAGRRASGSSVLALATGEELIDLRQAFGGCGGSPAAAAAQNAIDEELELREPRGLDETPSAMVGG